MTFTKAGMEGVPEEDVELILTAALKEDVGPGDWTSLWTIPEGVCARGTVVAKERLVPAGGELARRVFLHVDPDLAVRIEARDGGWVEDGGTLLTVNGEARAILTAERTALNILGHLSGIATLTRSFVERIDGTGARITDTRKTTPGWRNLEKYAVRVGGGGNHRFGLYDMVMIKDNHLSVAGGVQTAVRRVSEENRVGLPVEVEVAGLTQLDELRGAAVDRILLDNMDVDTLTEAVRRVRSWDPPYPELEASGNMSLDRIREVAETGVEWISVGALTHSAPAVDLSLRLDEEAFP